MAEPLEDADGVPADLGVSASPMHVTNRAIRMPPPGTGGGRRGRGSLTISVRDTAAIAAMSLTDEPTRGADASPSDARRVTPRASRAAPIGVRARRAARRRRTRQGSAGEAGSGAGCATRRSTNVPRRADAGRMPSASELTGVSARIGPRRRRRPTCLASGSAIRSATAASRAAIPWDRTVGGCPGSRPSPARSAGIELRAQRPDREESPVGAGIDVIERRRAPSRRLAAGRVDPQVVGEHRPDHLHQERGVPWAIAACRRPGCGWSVCAPRGGERIPTRQSIEPRRNPGDEVGAARSEAARAAIVAAR